MVQFCMILDGIVWYEIVTPTQGREEGLGSAAPSPPDEGLHVPLHPEPLEAHQQGRVQHTLQPEQSTGQDLQRWLLM